MGDLRSRETQAKVSYSGSGMSGKLVWVKEVEQRVESQLQAAVWWPEAARPQGYLPSGLASYCWRIAIGSIHYCPLRQQVVGTQLGIERTIRRSCVSLFGRVCRVNPVTRENCMGNSGPISACLFTSTYPRYLRHQSGTLF